MPTLDVKDIVYILGSFVVIITSWTKIVYSACKAFFEVIYRVGQYKRERDEAVAREAKQTEWLDKITEVRK